MCCTKKGVVYRAADGLRGDSTYNHPLVHLHNCFAKLGWSAIITYLHVLYMSVLCATFYPQLIKKKVKPEYPIIISLMMKLMIEIF